MSNVQANATLGQYVETRKGFNNPPNVGTVVHTWGQLQSEPWTINSTQNALLASLANQVMSISKVYNPDNSTNAFLLFTWTHTGQFWTPPAGYVGEPEVHIKFGLADSTGGPITIVDAGLLVPNGNPCAANGTRLSAQAQFDPTYFDSIEQVFLTTTGGDWLQCK